MDISLARALGRPVVCPAVIGRAFELEGLRLLMASPATRDEPLLLISGEAGIGKSRLVNETLAYARANGFSALRGQCFASDTASPFAPVANFVRAHFAHLPPGERDAALASVAGDLHPLLPDLMPLSEEPRAPPHDSAEERRRLFQGLAHVFLRRAARQPLLVVVEDVHWCDDATLDFLQYLARRCALGATRGGDGDGPRPPLLLLVTYRSDEVGPALGHWLAGLDRERLAREIRLSPLSRADVGLMVQAIFTLDRPAPSRFLDQLYALTEGNPFVVEELLKSLVTMDSVSPAEGRWEIEPAGGTRIPRSVGDAVRARIGRLSAATAQVLTLAAVAGRQFDFALLQQLTQSAEPELVEHIKDLVAAQLVAEESADRFVFRHALVREAIYSGLLRRERQTLHRTIADTLERLDGEAGDARVADLARHTFAAGDWPRALRYGRLAGERAAALYAPRAVIEHLGCALEASRRLGRQPDPELLCARGRAYEMLGDFAAACADDQAVLAAARAAAEPRAEWQALLDLGMLWSGRDYARAGRYYRSAYQIAKVGGNRAMLAGSLNRLGNWHLNRERPRQAMCRHRAALAALEGTDDAASRADTLDMLGLASYLRGDLGESATHYDHVVALAGDLDQRHLEATGRAMRMLCGGCYETETVAAPERRRAAGLEDGERAVTIAREIDLRSGEAFALISLAIWLGPRGEYGRALDAARRGLAVAQEIEHREWWASAHWALGAISLDVLAYQEARQHLERGLALAREANSLIWMRFHVAKLVELYATTGEARQAAALLAEGEAAEGLDMATIGQRQVWLAREARAG